MRNQTPQPSEHIRPGSLAANEGFHLSLGKKTLFSLVSVIIVLGTIELTARILAISGLATLPEGQALQEVRATDGHDVDRLLGWSWIPNSSVDYDFPERRIIYRFNSLGLRDDEISLPKPPGEYRILSIGDSTAFGFQVEDDEAYAHRLEVALQPVTSQTINVINAGVPGYTSQQCLEYLKHRGMLLEPDMVIMQSNFNDRRALMPGTEPDSVAQFEESWRQIQAHRVLSPSMAYRLIRHKFFSGPMGDIVATGLYDFGTFPIKQVRPRVSLAQYDANIREIIRISEKGGADVVLVGLPDRPNSADMIKLGRKLLAAGKLKRAKRIFNQALEWRIFAIIAQQELNRLHRTAGQLEKISHSIPATLPWQGADGYAPTSLSEPYIDALRRIGGETGKLLVVFGAQGVGTATELYMDYIHLNVLGHQRMAEQLAAGIEKLPGFPALPERSKVGNAAPLENASDPFYHKARGR